MRITAIALLLGTLGLAACDNNNNNLTIVPNVLVGTFALQTVNGNGLPATVVDSGNPRIRIDVQSGSITINANNTFTDVTLLQETQGGTTAPRTVTCLGTYTLSGTIFKFAETPLSPDCGRTFNGVVTGFTLNASVLGVPAAFLAQ